MSQFFFRGDSRRYIAERRLQLILLCDHIGIVPGCSGLYTVSAITTSTIVPRTATIRNLN
jgi:hypothetical protein